MIRESSEVTLTKFIELIKLIDLFGVSVYPVSI